MLWRVSLTTHADGTAALPFFVTGRCLGRMSGRCVFFTNC